jgi:hypothetical protein
VVAAPLGLGRVQRQPQPDRHERVLERRPRVRVRVDVPRRDARHAEPPGELGAAAGADAVAAVERALQLDPETLGPVDVQQPAQVRLVLDAVGRAPAQAHEALGVGLEVRERDLRLAHLAPRRVACVGVRAGEQAAQARPAGGVLHEQRDVPPDARPEFEVELRPVDRAQPQRAGRLRELHRAGDRVVVGQGERAMPLLERCGDELVGQRGAVEKREGGVAVELDVGR